MILRDLKIFEDMIKRDLAFYSLIVFIFETKVYLYLPFSLQNGNPKKTFGFDDLLQSVNPDVISRHKENGGAEFELPVNVLPPSAGGFDNSGLPVRFVDIDPPATTPTPSLVPLTDNPILWVQQTEFAENLPPRLEIDLTTSRSDSPAIHSPRRGKAMGEFVTELNVESPNLILNKGEKSTKFNIGDVIQSPNLPRKKPRRGKTTGEFVNDEQLMLQRLEAKAKQRPRQGKVDQRPRLVNFYPIHGKPFKSFIPKVEFASIT